MLYSSIREKGILNSQGNEMVEMNLLNGLLVTPIYPTLRGFVKGRVFLSHLPRNVKELRNKITEAIKIVRSDMLNRVLEESAYRWDVSSVSVEGHKEMQKMKRALSDYISYNTRVCNCTENKPNTTNRDNPCRIETKDEKQPLKVSRIYFHKFYILTFYNISNFLYIV
jgi:hypothetical protein